MSSATTPSIARYRLAVDAIQEAQRRVRDGQEDRPTDVQWDSPWCDGWYPATVGHADGHVYVAVSIVSDGDDDETVFLSMPRRVHAVQVVNNVDRLVADAVGACDA